TDGRLRRRADRQPRLDDERRDPRAAAEVRRRVQADDRHGHPRSARGGHRRPDPVPRRWPDREGHGQGDRARRARRDGGVGPQMMTVALRGLAGRKLRAGLTAFAIVLGVAMISGAYVLTDTINRAFDTIYEQTYKNADVVIAGKAAFENRQGYGVDTPTFPAKLLPQVQALPGVAYAAGEVGDNQTQLIDKNGKAIATGSASSFATSVDPTGDHRFNPLTLRGGRWPSGADQIAIDNATADKKHFAIGDSIGVASRGAEHTFHIVGLVKFSSVDSIGGSTISVFDLPTAQKLFGKTGELAVIRVQSNPAVPTSNVP